MIKPAIASLGIVLGLFAPAAPPVAPPSDFEAASLTIDYSATLGEAALVFSAESDSAVRRIDIRDPMGTPILRMHAQEGRELALSGVVLESQECDVPTLEQLYSEGTYTLRARSVDGRAVLGTAFLSHELPAAPRIEFPSPGAQGLPTDMLIRWSGGTGAAAYRVILEQGDSDGLSVELPAERTSLRVPDGVLRPDTETRVEVGAVGSNGNSTTIELVVRTR